MSLDARVIVITGASAGLGAGMAGRFSERGASLGLCARREPSLAGDNIVSRSVDVTDLDGLRAFAREVSAHLGPIDLWINNAALLEPIVPQRDLTLEQLEGHLTVSLGGVLNGTKTLLAQGAADGHRGALVNITSGLARYGMAGLSAYSAAKAGVDRLTEIVAIEESESLTMALAVSPGVIETEMQQTLRQQDAAVLHDVEMFRQRKADEAMTSPAWVADVIAGWVFEGIEPDGVVVRVPEEPA